MGCGCKGSKSETNAGQNATVVNQTQNQTTKNLSETIKKTVEKYYNKNKA